MDRCVEVISTSAARALRASTDPRKCKILVRL
jgi:hypothetical protein